MGYKLSVAAIQMDCTPAPAAERLTRSTNLIAQAVPTMMIPLYQAGVRKAWGSHMARD